MCKAIEDMREEVRIETERKTRIETEYQTRVENALAFIAMGKYSLEDIATGTGLPIEKVRELAGEKTA